MRCFYRRDRDWVEGFVHTNNGGRQVVFTPLAGGDGVALNDYELYAGDLYMVFCGYQQQGATDFTLASVDVVFHKRQIPKGQ